MPRGRPRKNPLPNPKEIISPVNTPNNTPVLTDTSSETPETTPVGVPESVTSTPSTPVTPSTPSSTTSNSKASKFPLCECCKTPIEVTPHKLNLTYLTTIAPYHFEVAASQPNLCTSCAKELAKVVDSWLISHGAETKFGKVAKG